MARNVTVSIDPAAMLKAVAAGAITPELAAVFLSPAERKARKVDCPVTHEQFAASAAALEAAIGDADPFVMPPKVFSTGSLGWGYTGKMPVKVGDVEVMCNVQVNITIPGSKPQPPTA